MFYSQFILAKKGPLGTIWIAAHLERKLRKNQVADTDIGVSVDSILFPEMPIALRLSSHLLLGVVRIYSRKVNYLFDDCSEALLKVKQAFRSAAVDLPPEESTAPYHSITLPETFDLDDFELPENENFQGNYVDHHISSKDQITLQDTMEGVVYSTSKFGLDERFGDGDASGLDLDEELLVEKAATAEHATGTSHSDVDPQASVQANVSLKYEENQEAPTVPEVMPASEVNEIEEYDGDNEPVEYAQAPCTPGLWEEPNLSKVQEISACDDHHEPENHSVTESVAKENLENTFSKEADCFPHEQQCNQFVPHNLDPTPFTESLLTDQVRHTSPKAEASGNIIGVDDNHEKRVELPSMSDNITHVSSLTSSRQPVSEGFLDINQTIELELNTEPSGKENFDNPNNHAVFEPKDAMVSVLSGHYSMQSSNFPTIRPCVTHMNHSETTELELNTEPSGKEIHDNPNDQALFEPKDAMVSALSGHYSMQSSNFPTIKPYMTHMNHSETSGQRQADFLQPSGYTFFQPLETGREEYPSASADSILVQGEGPHTTEELERNLAKIHLSKGGPSGEPQAASIITTDQVDNVIHREVQVGNINSYTSDLPAPEKLLYLPQGYSDVRKDLVLERTPAKEYISRDGGDARSDMLTGKKRSFTESSLAAQSLNLNESSGFFTTNRTRESLVRDDDLLSSILVGRQSSVIKMKPTPREIPSTKRRRSAPKPPKTGIYKRKVLMDDNMVLHGDIIRQQLTNTEDIRRLRKKAPCTRTEISMLEKQFWEDELFNDVIFTGVSIKLDSLHNQSYDLSKIIISRSEASIEDGTNLKSFSQNDENGTQVEMGTQGNFDPVATKDVSERQPTEFPLMNDDHPGANNTTNSDYFSNQAQMHETRDALEHLSSENELLGTEIDAKTYSDAEIGVSVLPIEDEVQVVKISETEASLQTDAPGVHSDGKIVDMDPHVNISINKPLEINLDSEIKIDDDASVGEISRTEHDDIQIANVSATLLSSETDGFPQIANNDQETEIKKNEEVFVNEDAEVAPGLEVNAQSLVSNGVFGEELAPVEAYDGNVNPVMEDVSLDDKEFPGHEVNYPMNAANVEDIPADNRIDDDELTYSAFGNDTDFLNFDDDDDDEPEAADDCMPDVEATRFIDNSGWSSRTKAVAKYLQVMFDKEGERGRNMLPVNNLLVGKTRKEASRMFFETLVLKTKDYIHVEQSEPFENINILPRSKLLKSDF